MKGILIFAGTTEGRRLAEQASKLKVPCFVSAATEYGASILKDLPGITVLSGRMDQEQIRSFAARYQIGLVIDATHPFAEEATRNIADACREEQIPYVRCLREREPEEEAQMQAAEKNGRIRRVCSVEKAVEYLKETKGSILIATGGKELYRYREIDGWQKRCYARVLSTEEAVCEAARLGFRGRHLIAMQGPFTTEMNAALLRHTEAEYFVTKESGKEGGFPEKLQAARQTGAELVVVSRPEEEGCSLEEVMKKMEDYEAAADHRLCQE